MLGVGISLFVLGAVIGVVAFAFGARNITSMGGGDFDNMFSNHGRAMFVMAIAGLSSTIGLLLIVIGLIQSFL